jgi:transcriptional regulator with XRE-family HTH domain
MDENYCLIPFGKLCAQARTYLTMTKPELAKQLGTTAKEISDIESGQKEPSHGYVRLVTGLLGLNIEEVEAALADSVSSYRRVPTSQPKYGS